MFNAASFFSGWSQTAACGGWPSGREPPSRGLWTLEAGPAPLPAGESSRAESRRGRRRLLRLTAGRPESRRTAAFATAHAWLRESRRMAQAPSCPLVAGADEQ
uniref:Uncharacterized protein n=1 Tax=Zea mays TaxID=4577 RepID=A0A804M572_MAIZE